MNTKSLLTRIGVPVLSLGLLGGLGAALATSAGASTTSSTVTAVTHENGVPDTTNSITPTSLPGLGYVWAYDNLSRHTTATQDSTDPTLWHVVVQSVGNYKAFADPRADNTPLSTTGSMQGEVDYTVHSTNTPSSANLGPQTSNSLRSGDILKKFFGDPNLVPDNSMYSFSYQINGLPYNQVG